MSALAAASRSLTTFLLLALCAASSAYGEITTNDVTYYDGDTELKGYLAYDESLATPGVTPAVVIIQDWDGIDDYEKQRAQMIAELGYVAFCADIYGVEAIVGVTDWVPLYMEYTSNITLFMTRMTLGIEQAKAVNWVDASKVAAIGYCFGGTGVINLATGGVDLRAVISFHGGLTRRAEYVEGTTIKAIVSIQSGGSDDKISDMQMLQDDLTAGGASWEVTRYSEIGHAFTVWGDSRYNETADMRSWAAMKEVLHEAFGTSLSPSGPSSQDFSQSPYVTQDVDYSDGDFALRGYLAYHSTRVHPMKAILLLPDWDGINQMEHDRADMLAEMGYVGFVADIYGPDFISTTESNAQEATKYLTDVPLFMARIQAGLNQLTSYNWVDADNVAVMGYCFGGTGVIDLVIEEMDGFKAAVSFHGGLTYRTGTGSGFTSKTPLLALSGGDDESFAEIQALEDNFTASRAAWELTRYGSGVNHAFTVWDGSGYNQRADNRSWTSAMEFVEHHIGVATDIDTGATTSPPPATIAPTSSSLTTAPTISSEMMSPPPPPTPTTDSAQKLSSMLSVALMMSVIYMVL